MVGGLVGKFFVVDGSVVGGFYKTPFLDTAYPLTFVNLAEIT